MENEITLEEALADILARKHVQGSDNGGETWHDLRATRGHLSLQYRGRNQLWYHLGLDKFRVLRFRRGDQPPYEERPRADPSNRIKVQLTYEISVRDAGLPNWLAEVFAEGVDSLIDSYQVEPDVILHSGDVKLTSVTKKRAP